MTVSRFAGSLLAVVALIVVIYWEPQKHDEATGPGTADQAASAPPTVLLLSAPALDAKAPAWPEVPLPHWRATANPPKQAAAGENAKRQSRSVKKAVALPKSSQGYVSLSGHPL